MKAWEIVGYTYDADVHCTACAERDGMSQEDAIDTDGNPVHPIFASDDGWEDECCGDCGEPLD